MHVAICSFIPHRVAPQQSSAMLQTAGTNIMLLLLSGKSITRYDNSRMAYVVVFGFTESC